MSVVSTENVEAAYIAALKLLETRVPLLGALWADEFFYLSPESSGTEGKWSTYPYQVAILNWMTSDDIEEINWQKSRRVGYTKCLMAAMGCLIEQKSRNVAVWQPTDGDAKDFVTDEVNTMLRDVPVLGDMLSCDVGAKSSYNTTEKKVFKGATLDIKGGKSARNFRRMSKDVAIYDELSAFDPDIDGEGSATEIGDGRLDQAPFPKSIRGSTPKTKNVCQIEAAVNSCDKVFYRYVKCPHCGELQRLEFANLKWDNDDPKTAHFVCVKNGCVLYYRDYPKMDKAGRWQTKDGYYYLDEDDTFYSPDGEKIDKPLRIGAKIWAAYSYLRPWSYIVDRWIAANNRAKTGDISSLKSVINTLIGETWEEKGEKVEHAQFSGDRLEHYTPKSLPTDVLLITYGADVQGGVNARVEVEVVGWGLDEESWSIEYITIPGDIDIDRESIADHLDDLLRKKYTRTDGVELRVSGGMIDAGYQPSRVFGYTKARRGNNIFATKGKSVYAGPFVGKGSWQGEKPNRAIEYALNTDEGKTTHFNRLRIPKPGPGYMHFPSHYSENYFKGLAGEEKQIKRQRGVIVGYRWVKTYERNEPLDCRIENMAAYAKLNPNMEAIKMKLDAQAERIKHGLTMSAGKIKKRRVRSRAEI